MKRILNSIWFFALIIAIPAILLFPPVFDKYKLKLISKDQRTSTASTNYFYDLDGDGKLEGIEGFGTPQGTLSFQTFSNEDRLIEQYNFPRSYYSRLSNLFFDDVNENNLLEVYGFTINNDSVFLNWIEPFNLKNQSYSSRFITTISTARRKTLDIGVKDLLFYDFDGDKQKEIIFSIEVGFNLFPRKIFMYNVDTDSMMISEMLGSNLSYLSVMDIDGDGNPELLSSSTASHNIPDSAQVLYKDNQPRIYVFDQQLRLKYPPVEFPPGLASSVRYYPVSNGHGGLTVFYHNYSSYHPKTFVTQVNVKSSIISDTIYLNPGNQKQIFIFQEKPDEYLVAFNRGKIYRIDENMEILDSIDLKFTSNHYFLDAFDIDKDGNNEYFVSDIDGHRLWIYFKNFRKNISIDFDEPINSGKIITPVGKGKILVQTNLNMYLFEFNLNTFYWMKYPGYILIYLTSVLFIWLVQVIRMRQLKEKYELQNQVHELQLKSLKSQLDPHFMHNTFNTIASVIKQGRNDEAYDLFVLLSKMVRSNLENTNEIYTSLKGELEFVKDYLSILKFRFRELFEYQIDVDKDVNTELKIPKMLLLIHVENALKHGIRNLKRKGFLRIQITKEADFVNIEIEDDGVGRKMSKQINSGIKGIGLNTIKQIIDLNNQKTRNRITQKIVDLKDQNGTATGTLIALKIML